jgi:hypothetical protein
MPAADFGADALEHGVGHCEITGNRARAQHGHVLPGLCIVALVGFERSERGHQHALSARGA